MTFEQLLAANGVSLPSYAPGRHYTTCPQCSAGRSRAHQQQTCLGVTIEPDDSVRWGCNHCGWTGPAKGAKPNGGAGQPLVSYIYRDRTGAPLFRKVRNAPGREPRFWLQKWSGADWEKGTAGVDTKIIYRADEVAKAVADGLRIACVEGEKDADSLWRLGVPATCNAHGASEPGKASKWTKAHSAQLGGADIVVLNDNDAAGFAHAEATCRLSLGVARRVRRLDLAQHWPDIPKGGDVSDWLAAGHETDELRALIDAAPEYAPAGKQDNGVAPPDDEAELARLARLSLVDYERARQAAAKAFGCRAIMLDRLVSMKRAELGLDRDDGKQGHALDLPSPEPWPEPVDGAKLLDDMTSAIKRHVVISEHEARGCALWCVHTYLIECFLISPRLAIRSATHRCGKTTLLDIVSYLALRTLPSANVTAASVFRVIEACRPTLLIDEADTFLSEADELRGVINSGHRRGGSVVRTVGDDHEPRRFSTYAACAIALIGKLPATLHDRSAPVVDLKRRLMSEKVDRFRLDRTADLAELARKAARWAADHADQVREIDPELPPALFNRDADNWSPLLAIAEAAGGKWPERAREAAASCCSAPGVEDASQLELLLADIRGVLAAKQADEITAADEITSAALVRDLVDIEGRPWAEMGKSQKPLTQNKLARMLKPLGIGPEEIGRVDSRLRGYKRARFTDAFDRYLSPEGGFPSVHPSRLQQNQATPRISKLSSPTPLDSLEILGVPSDSSRLDGWTVAKGGEGETAHVSAQCELGVIRAPRRPNEAENAVGAGATGPDESKPPNPPRRRTVL